MRIILGYNLPKKMLCVSLVEMKGLSPVSRIQYMKIEESHENNELLLFS